MLPAGGRFAFHAATCILLLAAVGASAEQRKPALELYGLGNAFEWGELGWRPELGGGMLAPIGRRWGLLWDVTGRWDARTYHRPFVVYLNGRVDGQSQMSIRYSQLSLIPSVVRLWRRERLSVYAGAGLSYLIGWERSWFRGVVTADEEVLRRLGGEHRRSHLETGSALTFRSGVLFSLGRRAVLRTGWRHEFHGAALRCCAAIELGVGYRFPN